MNPRQFSTPTPHVVHDDTHMFDNATGSMPAASDIKGTLAYWDEYRRDERERLRNEKPALVEIIDPRGRVKRRAMHRIKIDDMPTTERLDAIAKQRAQEELIAEMSARPDRQRSTIQRFMDWLRSPTTRGT